MKPTKEQELAISAILDFLADPETHTAVLAGSAGSGKSFCVDKIIERYGRENKIVVTAPTHQAVEVIADFTGLNAITLPKLLGLRPNFEMEEFDIKKPQFGFLGKSTIQNYKLVVIDECSMVNNGLERYLYSKAKEHKLKILYVGDVCQLRPINNGISSTFSKSDVKVHLKGIVRQKGDNPIMELLLCIRKDIQYETDNWVEYFNGQKVRLNDKKEGYIVLSNEADFKRGLKTYFSHPEFHSNYCKFLAYNVDRVQDVNKEIRASLIENADPPLQVNDFLRSEVTLVNDNEAYLLKNNKSYKVIKVKDYDSGGFSCWKVWLDNGKAFLFVKPESYNDFAQLVAINLNKALKERGKAWEKYYKFKEKYLLMDNLYLGGRIVAKKDFDYGYAITVHKSQGSSYDYAFVDIKNIIKCRQPEIRRELLYVALSRAKKTNNMSNLINEMKWYAKKMHAKIVYRKCIKQKKYKIAMKIAQHYELQDESKNDDSVMSLALALMSTKI